MSQTNPLSGLLNNPAIQQLVIGELLKLITGLINRATAPKPTTPVVEPTPVLVQPDEDFPDDTIPSPPPSRKIARVRLKLARAQYNRQRFPERHTPDNPMGLYAQDELRAIEAGQGSLNYGSKAWFDLTAYDEAGLEFLRDAVLSHGLAFKTNHTVGAAFITGSGAGPDGEPLPWAQNDTDAVGHGVTAWKSSLGFLQQVKFYGEGAFECAGSVNGVPSNKFTVRVS